MYSEHIGQLQAMRRLGFLEDLQRRHITDLLRRQWLGFWRGDKSALGIPCAAHRFAFGRCMVTPANFLVRSRKPFSAFIMTS
jgi:hypothetical protein